MMAEQNNPENPEGFQQAELFGIPALFSNGRIRDEDIPEGLYRYDLRGSGFDPGRPAAIGKNVSVNHAGSVLLPIRIPYLDHADHLNLGAGLSFEDGGVQPAEEFRDLWGGLERYPRAAGTLHDHIIRENENLVWAGRGPAGRGHQNVYGIYQIRGEGVPYEFTGTDYLSAHGLTVKAADYDLVYGGLLEDGVTPDTLYARFNTDIPDDYRGRSLSVSDVVVLNRDGGAEAFYVDRTGFAPLPDFVRERGELAEARSCIEAFLLRTYGHAADTRDPGCIPVARAAAESGKYDVEVFADLAACRLEKHLNGIRVSGESFRDLRDMIDRGLKDPDFSALTAVSEQEKERFQRARDRACAKAVEAAIDGGYQPETCRLDRTCCRAVVEEFGPDRTERVLAAAVTLKSGDGRFSPETRAWAEGKLRGQARPVTKDCAVESHPALLDGFIGFARQYMDGNRDAPEAPEPSI